MTSLSQESINNSLTRANSAEIDYFGKIDLTSGIGVAANTDYTTLKNGFARVQWVIGTNNFKVNGTTVCQYVMSYNTGFAGSIFIPVEKGSKLNYSQAFSFYPCYGG